MKSGCMSISSWIGPPVGIKSANVTPSKSVGPDASATEVSPCFSDSGQHNNSMTCNFLLSCLVLRQSEAVDHCLAQLFLSLAR